MGWREDVKFGNVRIEQMFLGNEAGGLGTQINNDTIIDLSENLTVSAAQIDEAVLSGGDPITIITDDTIPGPFEFRFATAYNTIVPMVEDGLGGAEGRFCVADILRYIRATTAEQALGDFGYAIVPQGSGTPGSFSTDPFGGEALYFFGCNDFGQIALELWVQGPSGNMYFALFFVIAQDNHDICLPAP
jgi:hypothetical protein